MKFSRDGEGVYTLLSLGLENGAGAKSSHYPRGWCWLSLELRVTGSLRGLLLSSEVISTNNRCLKTWLNSNFGVAGRKRLSSISGSTIPMFKGPLGTWPLIFNTD